MHAEADQSEVARTCAKQTLNALTHALELKIHRICLISPCTLAVAGSARDD